MEYGNLLEYIKRHPKANPFKSVRDLSNLNKRLSLNFKLQVSNIANGLAYIHSLRLVHGDIKSVSTPPDHALSSIDGRSNLA